MQAQRCMFTLFYSPDVTDIFINSFAISVLKNVSSENQKFKITVQKSSLYLCTDNLAYGCRYTL